MAHAFLHANGLWHRARATRRRFVVRTRRCSLATGMFLALCACNGDRGASQLGGVHGTSTIGGQVVSTVQGFPITVADVQALASAGLSAREALARLQAERLLMIEAERRGFGRALEVDQVARKARVQALLDAEAAAVVVSDADIRAAYEKNKGRFEKSERRASVHVLAQVSKKATPEADAAAKAFIEHVIAELRETKDLDAFSQQQHARSTPQFEVTSEKIPAVGRDAQFVKPYLTALFSTLAPGVVAEPVRTVFGWHAIRVTEILPAETTPYDKATEQLRAELLIERRKTRVEALMAELRKTYPVRIADNAAQTLGHLAQ